MDGSKPGGGGNVQVVCRVRPLSEMEKQHGGRVCVECDNSGRTVVVRSNDP